MKRRFLLSIAVTLVAACVVSEITFARGGGPGPNRGGGSATLTMDEAATLIYMREEEKLARDVYQYLYGVWGTPVFANIAVSEQRHMDALLNLINKYGLSDPAQGPGVFTNPDLQALYNKLIADGSGSVLAALEVGVTIEKTDMADLQAAIAETTKRDLQRVYTNLMNGSYNHLAAFEAHIASLAITP